MEALVKTNAILVLNKKSDILGTAKVMDACGMVDLTVGGCKKGNGCDYEGCWALPSVDVSTSYNALPVPNVCGSEFVQERASDSVE